MKKPVVVVSACLGFETCRYDGAMVGDELVKALAPFVTFVPVCPEVSIGLGIPRARIRLVLADGALRLVQPSTGRDLSAGMNDFAREFTAKTAHVDAIIMKSRSPSCALVDADRFETAESDAPISKGAGLFARSLVEAYRGVPAETERRLLDAKIRSKFLSRFPVAIKEVRLP